MDPARRKHPALERLRREKRRHAERGPASRAGVAAAGFVLVVVGILIIPVPGPWSLPVILTGLVLLALEFDWAERFLATTIRRTDAAKDAAVEASPTKKALGVLVFGLAVAAMVVAVMRWDVPFLPV